MKHNSILIFWSLILFLGTNIVYGNDGLKTILLPQSYQGTASLKVRGAYQSSIPKMGIAVTTYDYEETIEQSSKVNALLVGNYLIYMPAIDNPSVTGTVNYTHRTYWAGKPLITDIAAPQNITSRYSQGAIGLYINYAKNTYTLSIGLGAEGDSTHFDSITGKVESQIKKRFDLEKVELVLPLPKEMKVLKGSKTLYRESKNPEISHIVLKNKKTIEVAWEFVASNERVNQYMLN